MVDKTSKPKPTAAKAKPTPAVAKAAPAKTASQAPETATRAAPVAKAAPAPAPVKKDAIVAVKPAAAVAQTAQQAPKTKSAPTAAAPAPKPVEMAAAKVDTKAGAPVAPRPVAKTMTTLETAPAAAITEGSRTMNETVMKAQEAAKNFTSDASEKMQALFGDASARAKASYEKGVKMTEEFTEFQKGNVEAMVESGKLAAKAAESLGQEAADYARKSFESSTTAFKTFASAKSPTELFRMQSDYMKSTFETAVAESSKLTEAWLKMAGDVAQPLSNRFSVAVEKVKAASAA